MRILVLNCGSSSIKFRLFDVSVGDQAPRRLAGGILERVGAEATLTAAVEGGASERGRVDAADHGAGVERVLAWLESAGGPRPDAVGHRVVHGGARFTRPVVIDDDVIATIEALDELAPLHNAPSLAGIRGGRAMLGDGTPMVAVFDTSFHATLPEAAARYALPWELAERHGIRRFGFHGTSYRSLVERHAALTGAPSGASRIVALHLGNGCSAAAIRGGRSVETSMGFTPLEGLVMGTRAGDLDPALVPYLAAREGVSADEVARWLNERAGLLGVSGLSHDMRDLLARERHDPRARLAVEMFCHRARKYVGAYLAVLGGADAVVFTGGIGEHAAPVRERICAGFAWCGLVLDPARNASLTGEGRISADDARIAVFVVRADEEVVIAGDTAALVGGRGRSPAGGR
jgi:acetate kinase